MGADWESWGYSAYRKEGSGDIPHWPSSTQRKPTCKLGRDSLKGFVGEEGMNLRLRRADLDQTSERNYLH